MTKKIVLGSVLKPVNDARMYEKIAISLSRLEGLEIHIAGFRASVHNPPPNIRIHPLFHFRRLDLKRFLAPWKFYKLLIKVKPEIVLITTHDLLIVTCLYKILFGGKIIYDVQENYYRNIAFTHTFPPVLRNLIAGWVRLKEMVSRPFITGYLLAEKNYEKEFSFTKGKSVIIENKGRKPAHSLPPKPPFSEEIRLLYSGTISEGYGIMEAIDLAVKLHELDSRITLTIIGYSSKNQLIKLLKEKLEAYPFIHLTGGDRLVPHPEILKEIGRSHFGLLPYQPNKSTMNCIPTKLYEYLAYRLPMIVQHNPVWEEKIAPFPAGIMIDYADFNPPEVLQKMTGTTFFRTLPGDDIYWEAEEKKLLSYFNTII